MYDGMNLYRAVVSYASATTGDVSVRIPAILGPTEVLPVSKIGRAAVGGTWDVPLLGSQVVVAIEDDRFSNVYMVYPNLAVTQTTGGGDGGGDGGGTVDPTPSFVMPPGSIVQFGGLVVPDGWLLCDGTPKNTTEYPDLFAAIQYAYGGSGSTFNLPNLEGRFSIGKSSSDPTFATLGSADGSKTRTLAITNIPEHSHTLNSHTHTLSHTHTIGHTHTGSTDQHSHDHGDISSSGGHSHQVPFFVGLYTSGGAGTGPVGAAGTSSVTTSGTGNHSHSISNDYHSHDVSTGQPSSSSSGGASTTTTTGPSTPNTGNAGSASPTAIDILPPYIVVNYIIKV